MDYRKNIEGSHEYDPKKVLQVPELRQLSFALFQWPPVLLKQDSEFRNKLVNLSLTNEPAQRSILFAEVKQHLLDVMTKKINEFIKSVKTTKAVEDYLQTHWTEFSEDLSAICLFREQKKYPESLEAFKELVDKINRKEDFVGYEKKTAPDTAWGYALLIGQIANGLKIEQVIMNPDFLSFKSMFNSLSKGEQQKIVNDLEKMGGKRTDPFHSGYLRLSRLLKN